MLKMLYSTTIMANRSEDGNQPRSQTMAENSHSESTIFLAQWEQATAAIQEAIRKMTEDVLDPLKDQLDTQLLQLLRDVNDWRVNHLPQNMTIEDQMAYIDSEGGLGRPIPIVMGGNAVSRSYGRQTYDYAAVYGYLYQHEDGGEQTLLMQDNIHRSYGGKLRVLLYNGHPKDLQDLNMDKGSVTFSIRPPSLDSIEHLREYNNRIKVGDNQYGYQHNIKDSASYPHRFKMAPNAQEGINPFDFGRNVLDMLSDARPVGHYSVKSRQILPISTLPPSYRPR
jgi:hypothetical protein